MAGNASGSAVSTEREVYVEQTAEEFEAEFDLEGNPGLMEDGEVDVFCEDSEQLEKIEKIRGDLPDRKSVV